MSDTNDTSATATSHPQVAQLKFANEHIEPIVAGRKTATIRYEVDDFHGLKVGCRFQLLDVNGERFGSAIVSGRGYSEAEWIVKHGVDGHAAYSDLDEFLAQMREHYPDADLGPKSCFEIIRWQPGEFWE